MRDFQVRDDYPVYPARCRCGSQAGPVVDTLIDDHVGRLYLCPRCVHQAAGLHGWVPGETAAETELENERLRETVATLEQRLADASPQVVSVDELIQRMAQERQAEPEPEPEPAAAPRRRRAKAAA